MRGRLEIVIVVVAIAYLSFIVTLVRRRQLREKYALLWLAVGVVIMLSTLARPWADRVAEWLGFAYGPSAVFLFSTVFLMGVAAHLSWEVSRLEENTRRLAEEIALLKPEPPTRPDINLAEDRSVPGGVVGDASVQASSSSVIETP